MSKLSIQVGKLKNVIFGYLFPPEKERTINFNSEEPSTLYRDTKKKTEYNKIITTKYRWWNFIFLNLFEQFYYRNANIYFLFVAILTLIPDLSPIGSVGTMIGLVSVMAIQMIKDLLEDFFRYLKNRATNNQKSMIFKKGDFQKIAWKNIKTGDLLKISNKEKIPCDLIMLETSNKKMGSCFVETSGLDGETDLKIKKIPQNLFKSEEVLEYHKFNASVKCDGSNSELHNFTGVLEYNGEKTALGVENLLLRGSSLRNTDYIIGLSIYSGYYTKLMKNMRTTPIKKSLLGEFVNRYMYSNFIFHLLLCITLVIAKNIWLYNTIFADWYQHFSNEDLQPGNILFDSFFLFWSNFILFSKLVPIMLYVTSEVTKVVESYLINWDMKMYDEKRDINSIANTATIIDDLGMVNIIFSDKTGTLTKNEMKFLKCSINGIKYGTGFSEVSRSNAERKGDVIERSKEEETEFVFHDSKINDLKWKNSSEKESIYNFFLANAICQSVIVEEPGKYSAASPDEEALVIASKHLGFEFIDRSLDKMTLKIDGNEEEFEILDTLDFTSERKRMSIIVKDKNEKIFLFIKGADSAITPLLEKSCDILETTNEHLNDFGVEGLRNLMIGMKEIKENFEENHKILHDARQEIEPNRKEELLAIAYANFEKDIKLLGVSALEDKIQDGTTDCLNSFKEAGIKIWMLTGDKLDTAENISEACSLLHDDIKRFRFTDQNANSIEKISQILNEMKQYEKDQFSILMEGKIALATLMKDSNLTSEFVKIAIKSQTCIFCRVSPKQKGDIVKLMKKKMSSGVVSLAIGDGGNDVSMIQSANVGIGIIGNEGRQAANASDFAIPQFKHLKRLLLVHGHWAYRRNAKVMLYNFYKNMVIFLTSMYYAYYVKFSGTTLLEKWAIAFYNTWFTSLPIFAIGVFDQDLSDETCLKYPILYRQGHTRRFFNFWTFLGSVLNAFYHAAICFFIPIYIFQKRDDALFVGITIYYCVWTTVTIKSLMETGSWSLYNFLSILFCTCSWNGFLFVYGNLQRIYDNPQWRGGLDIFWPLFEPIFWLAVLLTVTTALIKDFLYKAILRNFSWELYYKILKSSNDQTIEYVKPTTTELKIKKEIFKKSTKQIQSTQQNIELEEMKIDSEEKMIDASEAQSLTNSSNVVIKCEIQEEEFEKELNHNKIVEAEVEENLISVSPETIQ
eukprot:gene6577-10740_t